MKFSWHFANDIISSTNKISPYLLKTESTVILFSIHRCIVVARSAEDEQSNFICLASCFLEHFLRDISFLV